MTRPRKATVDYFPHSCNHGKTIFILRQKFGNDGYAFWFTLLEILGKTEGHYLNLVFPEEIEFLSAQTYVSLEKTQEILSLLATLKAIDPELWRFKIVWSQNFVDNLRSVYDSRTTNIPEKPIIPEENYSFL